MLVRDGQPEVEWLGPTGPLLGALADVLYSEETVTLDVADTVLLYTDGVTEARNGNVFFGEERVRDSVVAGGTPRELVRRLLTVVRRFVRGDLRDDVALLAITVRTHRARGHCSRREVRHLMRSFEIQYAEAPHTCIVRLVGDVDLAVVPELQEGLDEALVGGCENVVLDLAEVTYADSSALGFLVWLDRRIRAASRPARARGRQPRRRSHSRGVRVGERRGLDRHKRGREQRAGRARPVGRASPTSCGSG